MISCILKVTNYSTSEEDVREVDGRELSRFYDCGWAVKVKAESTDRGMDYHTQITRLLRMLTGFLRVLLLSYGILLSFALALLLPPTTLSFACTLSYLFYCLGDRALRLHIYSIPPQYIGLVIDMCNTDTGAVFLINSRLLGHETFLTSSSSELRSSSRPDRHYPTRMLMKTYLNKRLELSGFKQQDYELVDS
jgi:hypothetical protein